LSKEDFISQINAWEFLEYAIVHGDDYYGTKWAQINEALWNWKSVLKELDLNWLISLKETRQDLKDVYKTIFLDLPIGELESRILKRQPNIDSWELEIRLKNAFIEEENLRKICDFDIDATLSEEEILKEVLKIMNNEDWFFDDFFIKLRNEIEMNTHSNSNFDLSDIDFSIFDNAWDLVIEFTTWTWEVIWEIVWGIFSNVDL
jgi:guanylate kinase